MKKLTKTNGIMKPKLIMFALFLLITALSYSQNSYPKKIVLDSDTIVAITPGQLIRANVKFIEYDLCSSNLKESKEYIDELEQTILNKDDLIKEYNNSFNRLSGAYNELDSVSSQIEKDNIKINRQNVRLKKNIKIFTGVSFAAGASLILILK